MEEDAQHRLEDFKNPGDVKEYMAEVDAKTARLFKRMTDGDLRKEVRRVRADGKEDVYTLEEIICHVPIEVIHYYGEIFAEFWKTNINAPYYSYLTYYRDKSKIA